MDTIEQLEREIQERVERLSALRKQTVPRPVKDYVFATLDGKVTLRDLFAGKDRLLAIHNMGQGCRYCTLWADGFNAFLPHLEHVCSVVLLSKDPPETQRAFALSRGWRFRMASHGGGEYIKEQTACPNHDNAPGVVACVLHEGKPARLNAAGFGPGDRRDGQRARSAGAAETALGRVTGDRARDNPMPRRRMAPGWATAGRAGRWPGARAARALARGDQPSPRARRSTAHWCGPRQAWRTG